MTFSSANPTSPNHALQRTAPGVTAPAPRRPAAQEPRRPPQSLSLGSLGVIPMHRLIPFIVCLLLYGCREPEANAPMLYLTLKGAIFNSVGNFRVFRTGPITADEDRNSSSGEGTSQSVTIDKIADDGVTLTVTLTIYVPNSPADESKKQIFIPYDRETTVALPKDTTLIAHLERKK